MWSTEGFLEEKRQSCQEKELDKKSRVVYTKTIKTVMIIPEMYDTLTFFEPTL